MPDEFVFETTDLDVALALLGLLPSPDDEHDDEHDEETDEE